MTRLLATIRYFWPAVGILVLFGLWELTCRLIGSDAGLPPPGQAIAAIWRDRDLLLTNASASVTEAILGLVIALIVAFLTASGLAMSRRAHAALMPLVLAQQTVPLVIISPLIAKLIGDGLSATVIFAAWLCWFPAAIAFTYGLTKVHPERLAVFEVAGASRWQTFRYLRLPGAAASLVAGARASAGFALIGAIVLEYGGAKRGLGVLIIEHIRGIKVLPADLVFALIIVCAALGTLITWGTSALARAALKKWLVDEA